MDAKQNREMIIAKSTPTGVASIAAGSQYDSTSLANGELVFVNAATGNVAVDLSVAGTYYAIGKTSDGDIIKTAPIDTTKQSTIVRKYIGATQKVDYIGYNGSTGSMPYGDNLFYGVTIDLKDGLKYNFTSPKVITAGYKSGSTGTQLSITSKLAKDLGLGALKEDLTVEFMCSGASVAITGAPTNWKFTKGSKSVTWTGTDPTNVAAGEYIRMSAAASTTGAVYEIDSVDATNNVLVLKTAFQGATATYLNAAISVIDAATSVGNCGIKIAGVSDTSWKRDYIEYRTTDWRLELKGEGFEDEYDLITNDTALVAPVGYGKQIADLETRTRQYFSDGMQYEDWGVTKRDQLTEAVATQWYDTMDVEAYNNDDLGFGANSKSNYGVTIAVPSLNYKVTVPASPDDSQDYTITIDGTDYTYAADSSSTTAEVLAGLASALGGTDFYNDGTDSLYVKGASVTVNSGATTADLTVAANTALIYPGVTTVFS